MKKILYVAGNTGKSIFCYHLANQLSHLGEKVVVISTDGYQSAAATLFPEHRNIDNKSLGKVLSTAILQKGDLFNNLIVLSGSLGYLSYAPDETAFHYPEIVESNVDNLLKTVSEFAEYVIIDTTRYPNKLDNILLKFADRQLLLTSADLKGQAFKRQFDRKNKAEPYCWITVQNSKYNPVADFSSKYMIPYCNALESIYNTTDITSERIPKPYAKVVYKIIKEELLCK